MGYMGTKHTTLKCKCDRDDFTLPAGWDICPCETPKCTKRDKCEKEAIMCLAFEEWSTGGKYKAERGKWFVPVVDMHYANKSNGAGKRAKQMYFKKVYQMYKDGHNFRCIARDFGITERSARMIVSRKKREEQFNEKRNCIDNQIS